MERLWLLLVAGTVLLPLAAAAPHDDCSSNGYPALGIVDVAGIVYVDDRGYVFGNGIWVYLESNQEAGLQRGGCPMLDFAMCEAADPCSDDSPNGPDSLVF